MDERVGEELPPLRPFSLLGPSDPVSPFLFNSPHSGRFYPKSFLAQSQLDATEIRRSEDFMIDMLFAGVAERGAPLLSAVYPRAYVDVNREPYELEAKMFREPLPGYANSRSIRAAGGLGTVPRIVSEGRAIYAGPIALAEAFQRIDRVYVPYHEALRQRLAAIHARFGFAVLVDCHSMPSSARNAAPGLRPDFVIGDRFGASCAPELTDRAVELLRRRGYCVARNKPYAGGFITEHYGRPQAGLHVMQVEVNRGLYMDEEAIRLNDGFESVQVLVEDLAAALMGVAITPPIAFDEAAE
ncbi:N-formylglutamate amidohydrolase [Rhodopseudomonas julia]|uniref:N-formylglutamate amidohydrolase n=1 Tax=Rhodopseudomonas julia TaxID=200617 RepID=A0ABU0C509_9BRAD|nr:N-formylglutamate amidohydrolase [Rhodopseudomonas julia]MDQ0325605.1 N-formylglutamate amidohydrolase [Rhodopseudomonas julia]